MKLVVASLVKNEAARFLPSALAAWGTFADKILILDDGSTDASREVAVAGGAEVFSRSAEAAWGREAPARAELWRLALDHSEPGDWIFFLDADMTPAADPRPLMQTANVRAWAFRLFDLWSEDTYRDDGFWQGHTHPRVWMVRRPEEMLWHFTPRGVHCGHLPTNLDLRNSVGIAPLELSLLHYAYSTPLLREAKSVQYLSVANQLEPQELDHARSILGPAVTRRLPFTPKLRLRQAPPPDGAGANQEARSETDGVGTPDNPA